MKLNELEKRSFVMAELNTYDLEGLNINKKIALKELKDELVSEIEDLNSHDTKKTRQEYFKVNGTKPDNYSEKNLIIDEHKKVIYGIRNMGGNPRIPFVQLRPNFEISSKEDSLAIYELIKNEFTLFRPLYLCFQTKDKINADFYGQVHMVAKTKQLINRVPWTLEKSISFEDITDNSYYDWYKRGYAILHAEVPELKTKVIINSANSMQDSLEQSLLKFININGEHIGLISAEKSKLLGHKGIYFNEIFISKEWRGKGLAKAIQRKFISRFSKEEYVWGTIDSSNLPSYKTAYTNGRRPISYECFINLDIHY